MKALTIFLLLAMVLATGCATETSDSTTGTNGDFTGATLATEPESGQNPVPRESTRNPGTLTLRLSGSPDAEFSGICTANGRETVITGKVPKKYNYRPGELPISCRIQKQSPGKLKVVLRDGGQTQAVQQTTGSEKGTIEFSYSEG